MSQHLQPSILLPYIGKSYFYKIIFRLYQEFPILILLPCRHHYMNCNHQDRNKIYISSRLLFRNTNRLQIPTYNLPGDSFCRILHTALWNTALTYLSLTVANHQGYMPHCLSKASTYPCKLRQKPSPC